MTVAFNFCDRCLVFLFHWIILSVGLTGDAGSKAKAGKGKTEKKGGKDEKPKSTKEVFHIVICIICGRLT